MEAHKCDRCGKYVDGDIMPEIRGWGSERDKVFGTPPRIRMELCHECFEALKDFLVIKKEQKACIDCEYFSDKEFYADNEVTACAVSFGSCINSQRNITSTNPHTEVPSWCPLKGDEDD